MARREFSLEDAVKDRNPSGSLREESTWQVLVGEGGNAGYFFGAALSKGAQAAGHKVAASYAGQCRAAEKFQPRPAYPSIKWAWSAFDACAAEATSRGGSSFVDVLVNKPAHHQDTAFHKTTLEPVERGVNTNLARSNMDAGRCSKHARPQVGRVSISPRSNGKKGQCGPVN